MATWSQIDFLMTFCIAKLLGAEIKTVSALTDTATTGVLINTLRRLKDNIYSDNGKKLCKQFLDKMGPILDKRNHLVHGIWGFTVAHKREALLAANHWPGQQNL